MIYIPAEASDDGTAKVVYTSKDRKFRKTFNALDWLARLVTHIPGRYEQMVRLLFQMRCHLKNHGKTGPG